MNKNAICVIFLCFVLSFSSCKKEDVKENYEITLIMAPQSLGDGGENDAIYSGIKKIENEYNVYVSVIVPDDIIDAYYQISKWNSDTLSNSKRLLILGYEGYKSVAEYFQLNNTERSQILLFGVQQSNLNIYTRMISKYGVSYLAGAQTVSFCQNNKVSSYNIIMANNQEENLRYGAEGFLDGVAQMIDDTTNMTSLHYISENLSGGYSDDEYIYRWLLEKTGNYFIYPLLGGNNDIFAYYLSQQSLLNLDGVFLMAGSSAEAIDKYLMCVYSVVVYNDNLMYDFVAQWIRNKSLEQNYVYGLDSKYVEFIKSPYFENSFDEVSDDDFQYIVDLEKEYLAKQE